MPFVMTHLFIAYNILNKMPQIKNPSDFLLGALAPDAVHFRENYNSDMKKKSHLCVGDEKWGRITNNQDWLKSVLTFQKESQHNDNIDFINGYCSHILADIRNNIIIWTPFFLENKEALEKGMGSAYHQESTDIDYALYLLSPQQKVIWKMLEEATGYDISDIVTGDEIIKMKHDILYSRFLNRKYVDISSNKYVIFSHIQEFISVESQYIGNLLYNNS